MRLALALSLFAACKPSYDLDRATMLDAKSCEECHPDHYREWSGSMHAYAADDPVFVAMNQRGQRETDGALGDLCINCHAPMAVRDGLTTDGLDVESLSPEYKGITCYFCHSAVEVEDNHNGQVVIADDLVLRGGIDDPVETKAHASAYSELHDRDDTTSAKLCGGCHDIVTPNGLELERTYAEWRDTIYAGEIPGRQQTCGNCHMQGDDGKAAAVDEAPMRRIHRHTWAGVDQAIVDFPEKEAQAEEIQDALNTTLLGQLTVCQGAGGLNVTYVLENIAAGHMWPSGAAQDRRAWAEVEAWSGDTLVWSTGDIPDEGPAADPEEDEDLWMFRDWLLGEDKELVHMFWEAHSYRSNLLPAPVPAGTDNHVGRTWVLGDVYPDRVTARVRMRAIGVDVIDDLIASGDLDASYRESFPVIDLAASAITWTGPMDICTGG